MESKILTRFELFQYGEAQRIGFLRGLEYIYIEQKLRETLSSKFNNELKMPPKEIFKVNVDKGEYIASYFTKEGLKKFNKEINNIVNTINDNHKYTVGKIEIDKNDDLVLYEDEYQVIQISKDLASISSAVADNCSEGKYKIIDTTAKRHNFYTNEVELQKIDYTNKLNLDIIVRPFYKEGELVYYIDTTENIVSISNEKIY